MKKHLSITSIAGFDAPLKMKTKSSIRAAFHSFGGVICAGAVLLIASNAQAQNLFVAAAHSDNIYEFTPGGTQSTFASGLNYPYGLAFDSSGDLFAANSILDIGTGGYVSKITPGGVQSTIPSGPDPKGLAFNSAGDLFETDYHSGNIYEYTPGGVLSTFATVSPAPQALAFNSAGNLFVGTGYGNGNESITEITPNRTQSTFASGLSYIQGLAFNSLGDLFEADGGSGKIYEFAPDGTPMGAFASGLDSPCGLAFNSLGDLFEMDSDSGKIYEFAPDGTPMGVFASGLGGAVGLAFQGETLPVPEPSALGLLAVGMFGLTLLRRRQR
ncbi:MAG: PEP-CTERM sorting domain-containing protein [Verrucomicrobiota bacterium]|jgi:DNA-binding beta-propeller fold protein YncE